MTQLFTTIASLRHYLNNQKSKKNIGQPLANVSVGLIPTMGALHTGHLSLIDRARKENVCVVVSIFVNPLQFGAGEDFEQYPRNLETDLHTCETAGVDAIFAPSVEEMGVTAAKVTQVIPPSEMTDFLCGRSRVGHFQGVATIVTKLLNIVQPDRAYFGNKDGQQLAIIRQLVNDLNIPVEIIGCPT
ncbi:MAG: pantoate--beta-alanine ligase, partial [Pseudanabaena sp.]